MSVKYKKSKVEITFLKILSSVIHGDKLSDLYLSDKELYELLYLAEFHNVYTLVFEQISEMNCVASLPGYSRYMEKAMTIVAGQVRRTETFIYLYKDLIKEDIHPIVMKGIICRQLYPRKDRPF